MTERDTGHSSKYHSYLTEEITKYLFMQMHFDQNGLPA